MRYLWLANLFLLVLICSCQTDKSEKLYDGFEHPSLSKVWDDRKFLPGALEIQKAIVRSGERAAKITLRPGDQIPQEKGTILERAELTEAEEYWSLEDSLYSYTFSIFLPDDFPVDSARLVIAQWKQECQVESCVPDNPLIAVRYVAGRLFITHLGPELEVLYATSENLLNRWLDFKFIISFSRTEAGSIEAWLNNEKVIDYIGINAYPHDGGYPDQNQFYFKTGLYRDQTDRFMTIYFDEYTKARLDKVSDAQPRRK